MFIGHFAVGFAAKRAAPRTSLAILLGSASLIDLLFPLFLLLGWERVWFESGSNPFTRASFFYPFSHSLAATVVWAITAASIYWAVTRYRAGAVVAGLAVLSHWVLDAISHKPDMPLYPGASPLVGLGLWYSVTGTVIVEGLMFAAGVWIYAAITRPRNRKGAYGLWSFVALMVLLYVANILGPPPPDSSAVGWVGLAFGLLLPYVAWFDRNREVTLRGPDPIK
ncbi:MAG: hypothetical protein Q8N47_18385 [Bryobacterales bacterium]|nr:hypothetical protein [Bryobacterales bacterium]